MTARRQEPAGPGTAPNGAAAAPLTKAARQAQIRALLTEPGDPVRSQDELADRLRRRGIRVTQATMSRDLDELGAVRLRDAAGVLVYALPDDPGYGAAVAGQPGSAAGDAQVTLAGVANGPAARLARIAAELLLSAEASANLVVLRTPPGAAQLLASAIDLSGWRAALGTIGGDDTVLLIARDPAGGAELARQLLQLAQRRGRPPARASEKGRSA